MSQIYHGVRSENAAVKPANKDIGTQQFYVGRIQGGELREQTLLLADPPVGQGFNHDMFITKDCVLRRSIGLLWGALIRSQSRRS